MKRVSYPGFSAEDEHAAGQHGVAKDCSLVFPQAHAWVPLAGFGAQFAFLQFSA